MAFLGSFLRVVKEGQQLNHSLSSRVIPSLAFHRSADESPPGDAAKPLKNLLGLNFVDARAETVAHLVAARSRDAPFAYVVTPNADHFVRLYKDPRLLTIYRNSWLCLMDSRVVAGAARLLGLPAPRAAPGSDLTRILLQRHVHQDERLTIIGLRPEFLSKLVERCDLAPPAHCYPPMGFDENPAALRAVVEFVLDHPARIILIAVGSPRQERLCAAIAATGRGRGTALCIGASLEYLAGVTPRAPDWMQQLGIEWLYRIWREPRRLSRRYLLDSPPVFLLLLHEAMQARGKRRGSAAEVSKGAPVH